MATVIRVKDAKPKEFQRDIVMRDSHRSAVADGLRSMLPHTLCAEIDKLEQVLARDKERIEEIRLRSNMPTYITVGSSGGKRNVDIGCVLGEHEISETLERMCDGSLYAYSESIIKGYVSLNGGVRVGVCGRASLENGKIRGVYDVSSLNIRLPCGFVHIDDAILKEIRGAVSSGEGVLIYSPPSQGKTTLLRSLAYELSRGASPLRVAVIDSRDELCVAADRSGQSIDVLLEYPKAEGIRIATAFMNPQVIICDEIGTQDEAVAIAQAQNCGVPLIASAHGVDVEGIMKRSGMKFLHDVGAFSLYVGIKIGSQMKFEYRLQRAEEVCLENIGYSDAII